ncbi:MAG: phosphatidate cytidylyltransferase [Verrucomicrobiota bacterium]|nr:phosphatidate cytidylyltransferase [Verrucomicrobiota bacterium]
MKKRIFSTVGIWVLIIGLLYFVGPVAGVWLLTALALATQRELYVMLEKLGGQPYKRLGLAMGAVIMLGAYYLPHASSPWNAYSGMDLLVMSLVICAFTSLITAPEKPYTRTLMPTLFAVVLIPFTLQFLVAVMMLPMGVTKVIGFSLRVDYFEQQGLLLAIWIVAVAKFCDVGALLTGMAIGKHKFSPALSPKKTWEGVFGGIAGSVGIGVLFVWTAGDHLPSGLTIAKAALIAVPISIANIASDLLESAIKREAGVKDSGTMIPGIGGAFDLADSFVLSAPVGYYLLRWLIV